MWEELPGHTTGFLVDRRELTLTATTCAGGYGTPTVDGSFGGEEWGCAHSAPLTVDVDGHPTPVEVYWMNDATNLYLAVRVQDPTFATLGNNLRFDFDNDGLGTRDPGDDAIAYEIGYGFIDEHLTAQCIASGYVWCQSLGEASQDGAGAVGSDATWSTYELSHPLVGTRRRGLLPLDRSGAGLLPVATRRQRPAHQFVAGARGVPDADHSGVLTLVRGWGVPRVGNARVPSCVT